MVYHTTHKCLESDLYGVCSEYVLKFSPYFMIQFTSSIVHPTYVAPSLSTFHHSCLPPSALLTQSYFQTIWILSQVLYWLGKIGTQVGKYQILQPAPLTPGRPSLCEDLQTMWCKSNSGKEKVHFCMTTWLTKYKEDFVVVYLATNVDGVHYTVDSQI